MNVSLVTAAQDRRLLAATLTLRPRQLALLASLEGAERTHVWAIARQAGKSTLAAMAAVHGAVFREDLDAMLPRGRTRYALIAAPGQSQASEFVRLCEALIEASPTLRGLATVSRDRIDFALPSGARSAILALPANSRAVRGTSASLVVMDEMAHFSDTSGPGSDARMLVALEPSTRVFGDAARILICSTPFGQSGRFHELFTGAQSGTLPNARATHAAAWEFDPLLDEAWRERKRAEVGDAEFAQEYGAEFIAGGGQFFDLRDVEFEDDPAAPDAASRWVAGLDPAFASDTFGIALVGVSASEPGVLVVGRLEGIKPGGRLRSLQARRGREDRTLAKVRELLAPYAAGRRLRVVTDQHMSDAVSSALGRDGIGVKVVNLTAPVQTAAFTSTRARITDGSLRLWRHEQTLEELRRVRARDTESIVLPRFGGSHCDIASALALAVAEFGYGRPIRMHVPRGRFDRRVAAGLPKPDVEVSPKGAVLRRPTPIFPPGTPAWQRRLARRAMQRPEPPDDPKAA